MPARPSPPRFQGYIVFTARTGSAERLRGLVGTRSTPVTSVTRGDVVRTVRPGKRPLIANVQAPHTLLRFALRRGTPAQVLASARAFIARYPKPARTRCTVEIAVHYYSYTLNLSFKPQWLTLPGVDEVTISCYPTSASA